MNVTIIPFGKEEALEAARSSIGNWDLIENPKNYTICAKALKLNAKLVNYNKKHFKWLKNVLNPDEVMGNGLSH